MSVCNNLLCFWSNINRYIHRTENILYYHRNQSETYPPNPAVPPNLRYNTAPWIPSPGPFQFLSMTAKGSARDICRERTIVSCSREF